MKLSIHDEEPEQKDFAKYLGVYFDKQLSWSKQIEIKNNKLHKGIGILTRLQVSSRRSYEKFIKSQDLL